MSESYALLSETLLSFLFSKHSSKCRTTPFYVVEGFESELEKITDPDWFD